MAEPGVRKQRVVVFALERPRDLNERLQPQGRSSFRTHEQIRDRGRRAVGEGNGGVHRLPGQRSSASRPPALHQSAARGSEKDCPPSRLPGRNQDPAQVNGLPEWFSFTSGHAFRRVVNAEQLLWTLANAPGKCVFLALISISLVFSTLTGCSGEHKQARVTLPPPPPISEPQAQTSSTAPEPAPAKKESAEEEEQEKEVLSVPPDTKPMFVETG